MATLNQINASRKNGARSKGPVTPEGKARVSQNGTTHGIYSKRVVLQNEDPAAYQTLRDALLNDWGPTSAFERNLILDIAEARWRLSRFTTLETAALDFEVERMRPEVASTFQTIDEATRTVLAFNALLTHNHTHHVLQAASLHQHRIIDRATTQLLRLRKIRPGNNNPGGNTATEGPQAVTNTAEAPAPPPAPTAANNNATKNTTAIRRTKPEPAAITEPAAPPKIGKKQETTPEKHPAFMQKPITMAA